MTPTNIIPPRVGDALWYIPGSERPLGPASAMAIAKGYLPAIVERVHTDRVVDIEVTDDNGDAHQLRCVTLRQRDDPLPDQPYVGHCQWGRP